MKFLRNLFGMGKKEEVEFDRIEEWLNNYSEADRKELKDSVNEIYDRLYEKINLLNEKIKALKEAKFEGNVHVREVHFMEGNREAYIKKLKLFIESIQLPDKEKYEEIIEFHDLFENELNEFGKNTIKSYSILKQFFDKISTDIARTIKEIETEIKNLVKAIDKSRMADVEKAKKKFNAIKNAVKAKEEMCSTISEKSKAIKELGQRKAKTEKEIDKFKSSSEFINYHIMLKERENIFHDIRKTKDDVLQMFSGLDKALKKYKRDSLNEKLIDLYLENPSDAILEDKNFEILEVLETLKKLVEDDKIELEEKKKEKTLQVIESINQNILLEQRSRINDLKEKVAEKNQQIEKSPVMLNYKDIEYKLEHVKSKIKEEEANVNKIEQNRKKIDEEELKQELEKEMNDFLRTKISII